MANSFITLMEAEKISGVNQETLKKRCQSNQIPGAVKKGKTWLIPLSTVIEKEKPRAGVYIDGSNIYCGGKDAGWQLDYSKLKNFLERKYSIAVMSYYNCTGYAQNDQGRYIKDKDGAYIPDPKAIAFENFLKGMGIRVQSKPLKFILGDERKPSNKMDGDLMIDAILEHSQWDELILFSGDCDFEKLVKQIASYSKKVSVFSFSTRLSHELKLLAFSSPYVTFTVLDELERLLKYNKSN